VNNPNVIEFDELDFILLVAFGQFAVIRRIRLTSFRLFS